MRNSFNHSESFTGAIGARQAYDDGLQQLRQFPLIVGDCAGALECPVEASHPGFQIGQLRLSAGPLICIRNGSHSRVCRPKIAGPRLHQRNA